MLKITRAANGEVVFTVSGRLDAENLAELETLFRGKASGRRITLDLTRADAGGPKTLSYFLALAKPRTIPAQELSSIHREWIVRERGQS